MSDDDLEHLGAEVTAALKGAYAPLAGACRRFLNVYDHPDKVFNFPQALHERHIPELREVIYAYDSDGFDWDELGDLPYAPLDDLTPAEITVLWATWQGDGKWIATRTINEGHDSECYEFVTEILGAFWHVCINENMAADEITPYRTREEALSAFNA